jgi:hypothetical protein
MSVQLHIKMIDKCCACGCDRMLKEINEQCHWCMLDYALNAPVNHQKQWAAKCKERLVRQRLVKRGLCMVDATD